MMARDLIDVRDSSEVHILYIPTGIKMELVRITTGRSKLSELSAENL